MIASATLIPLQWDHDVLAVLDAVAIVGNVLCMEGRRREALRGAQDPDLNGLVLSTERQLLWDALQRLRHSEYPEGLVLLSEEQATCLRRLHWLKHGLGGDPALVRLILALQAEIRLRTKESASGWGTW